MEIRFGFVANTLSLWEVTPSSTLTFTRYKALPASDREQKLLSITEKNIDHTLRILYFIVANGIEVYRMSSSIVPLATHPDVLWDFMSPFQDKWKEVGTFVEKYGLRTSFHPNQFTLFTSPREEVTKNAVIDMEYHYRMLEAMGIEKSSVINIHIGGTYGDKENTLKRFHQNLKSLPSHIKEIMTLENDDKTYTARETLQVCQKEGIPFVFDYHHHMENPGDETIETIIPDIFETWKKANQPPKIHISSPKSDKQYRAHADYVDVEFMKPLLSVLKDMDQDVDIMIEAKAKDLALFRLVEDISRIRGVKRIRGGAIRL
ncbi:UV DNA damage repair endonuclease UvsE [Bacillus carboniphilus]|uniref:UV DNA damage endonuclease n=1 Tax=Bacillus carboniphilus TaxID=86663 RepID=A0ABN0VYD1_9BACI